MSGVGTVAPVNARVAELRVLAGHASALEAIERGDDVRRELGRLVATAERAGLAHLAGRVRLTLAWLDVDAGRFAAAARRLATARAAVAGEDVARARCLAGLLWCATGRHGDAITELAAAIPALRRAGDRHWLANALVGRGTAAAYLRRPAEADADFAAAAELFGALGERGRAAACLHNRGFAAYSAGDLPAALRRFADAEAAGLDADRHPEGLVDRAQTLAAAGLTGEARPVLARAATLLARSGRGGPLAEATLAVAHCALRAGDPAVAAEAAADAARWFRAQGRDGWLAAARAVRLTARLRSGARVPVAAVRAAAVDCDRHRWVLAAAELRLTAAGWARPAVARELLTAVARHRHDGQAAVRALAWLAHARLAELHSLTKGQTE
jgi:tetratricopeptide (TPR) repeat protein